MSTARRPLPTDLVALVTFDGRVYPNEAKPLEQLGLDEPTRPLETALEQWFSFATGKHTWVSVRGATIRGLITARRRAKPSVWEVDALIDIDEDDEVAASLFGRATAGLVKEKAERVFLRLDEDSSLRDAAREAGFFQYARETLYRLNGPGAVSLTEVPLRSRKKSDLMGIYQLYNQTVPANVRAIEGSTFREWQAAQEAWGARTTDLLLEENGIISAWLRLAKGHVGRFSILAGQSQYGCEEFVRSACARLNHSESLLTLVRQDNPALALNLERMGFRPAGNYVVLAKRLARPIEELSPEATSEAIPVS